jgi:hypothetical protein
MIAGPIDRNSCCRIAIHENERFADVIQILVFSQYHFPQTFSEIPEQYQLLPFGPFFLPDP